MPDGSVQMQMVDVQIDEPLMKKIATETGGRYFRATNNSSCKTSTTKSINWSVPR